MVGFSFDPASNTIGGAYIICSKFDQMLQVMHFKSLPFPWPVAEKFQVTGVP